MNNANRKTTLNTDKTNIILIGIIVSICTNGYTLHQMKAIQDTLTNQNQTETTSEELNTDHYKTIQVEGLISLCKSKNDMKSKNDNLTEMAIPDYDTSFKSYMSYKCITNKSSNQYKLQQKAYTDNMGLRKVDDYYLVAMGTYYSDTIGDKFRITLEGDKTFDVMIGDIKADIHTDKNNMYSPVYNSNGKFISANVIEFIVDISKIDKSVRRLGSVNAYDEFKGNIAKIERIEPNE